MWHYTRQNTLYDVILFFIMQHYTRKNTLYDVILFFIMWHYTRQNTLWCYPIFYNVACDTLYDVMLFFIMWHYTRQNTLWCYPIFYNVALYQTKHSMMLSYFLLCGIIPDKTLYDVILFFIMWHYTRQNTLWCYPIFYNVTLYQTKHSMMLSYFL